MKTLMKEEIATFLCFARAMAGRKREHNDLPRSWAERDWERALWQAAYDALYAVSPKKLNGLPTKREQLAAIDRALLALGVDHGN